MRDNLLTLFLEINQLALFFVTKSDDRNNWTVYKIYVPIVEFQIIILQILKR